MEGRDPELGRPVHEVKSEPKNEEVFFTLDAFESRKICQEARQAQFDDQAKQAAAQGKKSTA